MKGRRKGGDSILMKPGVLRSHVINVKGCNVTLLGTVKGLSSERDLIRSTVKMVDPDKICLHISREEMEGLVAVVDGEVENTYLSSYERVYAKKLSVFGEVQVPPPSIVEALIISREIGVDCIAIDLDEECYSSRYTELIGPLTMINQSLRLKRVNRRKFKADTVEEFVKEWDGVVNRARGFRKLEELREKHMASEIASNCKEDDRLLCVLELERVEGVKRELERIA